MIRCPTRLILLIWQRLTFIYFHTLKKHLVCQKFSTNGKRSKQQLFIEGLASSWSFLKSTQVLACTYTFVQVFVHHLPLN